MATPAQIRANQRNVRDLPAPARRRAKLLPGDDLAEYQAMLDDLGAHFGPKDITEARAVREMADAERRLRRQDILLTEACENLAAANPSLDAATRAFDHDHFKHSRHPHAVRN